MLFKKILKDKFREEATSVGVSPTDPSAAACLKHQFELHMVATPEDQDINAKNARAFQGPYSTLFFVGLSPLLTEDELFFLLTHRMVGSSPSPTKVILFDQNASFSTGIALVQYPSFSAALEAKRNINLPNSMLNRFFGPNFEGAIVAEPPLGDLVYRPVFRNECTALRISNTSIFKRPLDLNNHNSNSSDPVYLLMFNLLNRYESLKLS